MAAKPQTSLDLLQPQSATSQKTTGPKTIAEEKVRALTLEFAEVMNNRKYDSPIMDHVSPSFSMRHVAGAQSITVDSKASFLETWQEMFAGLPNYETQIHDVQVDANIVTGRARAWLFRTARGLPDGLKRDTVAEMQWERRDGVWYVIRYRGLRGLAWYESEAMQEETADAEVDHAADKA